MMKTKTFKQPFTWCELDLLIMYIADDPKRFIKHIAEFGYTTKEATEIQRHIQRTLAAQANDIIENRQQNGRL
jgi:hypothetical protein